MNEKLIGLGSLLNNYYGYMYLHDTHQNLQRWNANQVTQFRKDLKEISDKAPEFAELTTLVNVLAKTKRNDLKGHMAAIEQFVPAYRRVMQAN